MIVNDPNVIVGSSGLAAVDIIDQQQIKITLKNGTTLTLTPKVEEDRVVDYEMVYLTGRENKQIAKMKEKIAQLQNQIATIKDGEENNDEDNVPDTEDTNNN